jgi:endo-1,4-beta-xylanase
MKRFLSVLLLTTAIVHGQPQSMPTLKDAYKGYFRIGAALNQAEFEERDPVADPIIEAQFNAISPENALKWQSVHPQPGTFNFDSADKYVAFGEKHKMFILGHCLVWHSQTPKWVFEDADGKPLTRDALLERMKEHIHTVVGRYKGRINGWDVVNEALNEDGTMRQSPWYRIIGDDFIAKAFQFAHEADPNAELYYNDYSLENDAKRKGAVELIRKLKAAGVPITGIGLQGHMKIDTPSAEKESETIEDFAKLGVRVNVSELDVDVLPRTTRSNSADISMTAAGTAQSNPYTAGLPEEMQQRLAKRYTDLFKVFLDHHESMGRVTLWGVTDRGSWLNNFPTRGRTNYPLLFDREGKPKPAFSAVIQDAVAYRAAARGQAQLEKPARSTEIELVPSVEKPKGFHVPKEKDYAGYLLVYFKDQTQSAYLAISRGGYTYTDVNDGQPVFEGNQLAEQKGVRDPHITRGPDGAFYLAMTDLHIFGQRAGFRSTQWERPIEQYGWGNNRALVLMKSWDLIHWTHSDLRVDKAFPELGDIATSWAPETIYDPKKGKMMVYFTIRFGTKGSNLYYSYANSDFTKLETKPELLASINGADGDITKVGDKYQLFYVSGAQVKHGISKRLTGGYELQPQRIDPEKVATEAPTIFKRLGANTYVLMYDVYGARPNNMGFSETIDFVNFKDLGHFNEGVMKTTNFTSPKHGAVTYLTEDELKAIIAHWNITSKVQ